LYYFRFPRILTGTALQWRIFVEFGLPVIIAMSVAAFATGIAKNGIPGFVTILMPFMAMVMPARQATGMLLPLLVFGDILSVFYWKRKARWRPLIVILIWSLIGVVIGYFLMRVIDDETFRPLLGGIIVAITILSIIRNRYNIHINQKNIALVATVGILSGTATILANGAAPLMAMYWLSLDMDKEELVGTNAWYFLVVNMVRIPFSVDLGIINSQVLRLDAMLAPLVIAGGIAGIFLLKRIDKKAFTWIMQGLALVAGIRLLI